MIKPDYYQLNDSKDDLFSFFEKGLLTTDEARGFYKGNVIKYVTRYQDKNGVEDLEKAQTYLDQLTKFEEKQAEYETEQKFLKSAAEFGNPFTKKALRQNNGSAIIFYE